jgi:uncharacterized protein
MRKVLFIFLRWLRVSWLVRFLLLVAVAGFTAACQMASNMLVKPPRRGVHESYQKILQMAPQAGISIRPGIAKAPDGADLAYLVVTKASGNAEPPSSTKGLLKELGISGSSPAPGSAGTLLMLHGYKSRKEQWLPKARDLAWAGFTCILLDSRAHGESGGEFVTFGHQEVADTAQAWKHIKATETLPNPQLSLIGYSMGGAIALQALDVLAEVKSVVTFSTFDELERVVKQHGREKFGLLGRVMYGAVAFSVKYRTGMSIGKIRPAESVARHTVPLFIIHGTADNFIPPVAAENLQKNAGGPCQIRLQEGRNHWSAFYDEDPKLLAQIVRFVRN